MSDFSAILPPPIDAHILQLIRLAVEEDLSAERRDRTVELTIPAELQGSGTIVARKPGIISGTFLLEPILANYPLGHTVRCTLLAADGSRVAINQPVATLEGPAQAILSAERVLLNFLGHLSGIATLTRRYVDAVAKVGSTALICDTRKTTPGFRTLDKYAVRCGGGTNHRMGLYDGVMLKDNHLAALRDQLGTHLTLAQLTRTVRVKLESAITLWLEVDTLAQLADALSPEGRAADIILLDNFTPDQMRQAVALRNAHGRLPLLEASGGVTLDTLPAIAQSGVERISIGALTHSAPVLDLALDFA